MFYIKDIDAHRQGQGTTTAQDLIGQPPSEQEIQDIVVKREKDKHMSEHKLFQTGTVSITDELAKIRDALLVKDGIVPAEK